MTIIRPATEADLDALVALGVAFHAAYYADHLASNPAQYRAIGEFLLASPDGALLVLERDGTAIGMMGLQAFTHPLSGERMVGELFWFTDPQARGDGVKMLRHAEAWGKAQGALRMQLVAPTERVEQFYQRLGYARVEAAYSKKVA